MAEISVIVPVYNVEKYLRKCLDSILSQTFQDFELILINDGSADASGEICREYAAENERVRFFDQKNKGPGYTRNRGIQEARGRYILFVDSDDYIAENMLELLYGHVTKSGADMATCGVYNVFRQTSVPQYEKIERFECSGEEAFGLLLVGEKIPGSSCNKLIRSEILKGIRYPEGILYEDVGFHTELMQKVERVYVDTTPLYYYVHRENSITTKKFDSDAMMFIYAYEDVLRVVQKKYPALLTEARFKLFWAYFSLLDRMLREEDYRQIPEYPKVKTYLKRNVIRILRNPYFHLSRKAGAAVLFLNVRLYRKMIMEHDRRNRSIF